ncbi:MFS transporter [Spiractinospora alimapuensis]|uniref:MFS transporter n=1 Tax=Spiractinospora alimapuensis TaxID=2820884 RepID=UPI001F20E633|nr:MFS transporter [Spiractinospora alimapuensis]
MTDQMEARASSHEDPGHPRRWAVLAVVGIAVTVVVLENTILNVALRVLADPQEGLGATQSELAWSINSYTLLFAGLLITFGVVGDRFGRRRVLAWGLVAFGVFSVLSAYSVTPEQLILTRALKGLAGAAVMPQTLAIITNVFPRHERGRAIGIWAAAVGVGLCIGPTLGGLMLVHFWWGSIFLINVPIVVLALALMAWLVPESRNEGARSLDPVGVLLSIVGLLLLLYGIIAAGDRGSFLGWDTISATVGGFAILAAFVWWEAHAREPALNVRLFRDPRLSVAVAAIMLVFFALAGVFFFGTFYLQSVRGLTPFHAGLLIIPIAVGQLVFSPLSPALVARWGARRVCSVGLIGVSAALAAYTQFGTDTPLVLVGLVFLLQGSAMATVMVPATNSIMSVVPPEQAGSASALQNTARQVAVSLGVAVLGTLLSFMYRRSLTPTLDDLPEAVRDGEASIEETLAAARTVGEATYQAVLDPAKQAFLSGMHTVALCSALIALAGAVTVAIWMPGRSGPPGSARTEDE